MKITKQTKDKDIRDYILQENPTFTADSRKEVEDFLLTTYGLVANELYMAKPTIYGYPIEVVV